MAIIVNSRPSELVLTDTIERIDIALADAAGAPVVATQLSVSIRDLAGGILYSDDFFAPPTPPGVTRIVNPAPGRYYFPLGDPTLFPLTVGGPANQETRRRGRLLALWKAVGPVGTEQVNVVQNIRVVSPRTLAMAGDLRVIIDKAAKTISEDPADPCFLGYTDSMLVQFLEEGLSTWNLYEPYPTFCTLDDFPLAYEAGLIDAAVLRGVMSQELFAIDTDIPNYSAQGAAFVLQHQPALAQYFNKMAQRLDKIIPIAKLKLVQSGSIHVEIGGNFRLQQLVQAAPPGALFRNFFISGA